MLLTRVALISAVLLSQGSVQHSFEASSVKVNPAIKGIPEMNINPGRIRYTWVTLTDIVQAAYNVRPQQVAGPDWLSSARYDIEATAPGSAPKEQLMQMLQNLLVERFKLQFHHETRDVPVFVLQAEKRNRLTPSSVDEVSATQISPTGFVFQHTTMAEFAKFLSSWPSIGRPVVDETGLNGRFDFAFDWFDADHGDIAQVKRSMASGDQSAFLDAVSRIGLQLQSRKSSSDVLVIDHVERTPKGN